MRSKTRDIPLIWPGIAFIIGGVLMAVLWVNYTGLHGPTSFNEQGYLWGRSPLFWGSMLSGPPSLLIGLGLLLLYPTLGKDAGRLAKIGYGFTMVGLLVPAVIDLIFVVLGPPLLIPVFGAGLVLMAVHIRKNGSLPGSVSPILLAMGILLLASFLWALLLPMELSDRIAGYRVFGVMAHFLFGIGWVVLGITLLRAGMAK